MKGSSYFLVVVMVVMLLVIAFSFTLEYISPKVLPIGFSIIGLILGAIQLVRETSARGKPKAVTAAVSTTAKPKESGRGYLINVAWIGGFVLFIYLLGILISTTIFVLAYMRWLGARWHVAIISAIITPTLIYALFQRALEIELPWGLLFSCLGR